MLAFIFCFLFFQSDLTDKPPVSLDGSKESRRWQNIQADKFKLIRISNSKQLKNMHNKPLVRLPSNKYVKIDRRLKREFRWCQPWVKEFILYFADKYYKEFKKPWYINSAVRTKVRQRQLQRRNKNAIETEGEYASSHLTGATIDIAIKPMSNAELDWMRDLLLKLEADNLIDATEELHQRVFHIMVFPEISLENIDEKNYFSVSARYSFDDDSDFCSRYKAR